MLSRTLRWPLGSQKALQPPVIVRRPAAAQSNVSIRALHQLRDLPTPTLEQLHRYAPDLAYLARLDNVFVPQEAKITAL